MCKALDYMILCLHACKKRRWEGGFIEYYLCTRWFHLILVCGMDQHLFWFVNACVLPAVKYSHHPEYIISFSSYTMPTRKGTIIPNLQIRKLRFRRPAKRLKIPLLAGYGIRIKPRLLSLCILMPGGKCNFKNLLPQSTVHFPPYYTYRRHLLNALKWLRMGAAWLWGLWKYRLAVDQSCVTIQPQEAIQGTVQRARHFLQCWLLLQLPFFLFLEKSWI